MANKIVQHIDESVTAVTDYYLQPGVEYDFSLNGTGTWQFYDGGAWVTFSAGAGKNFVGSSATGKVRANRASGTCVLNVVRHQG